MVDTLAKTVFKGCFYIEHPKPMEPTKHHSITMMQQRHQFPSLLRSRQGFQTQRQATMLHLQDIPY
jgi:hypothetical protein